MQDLQVNKSAVETTFAFFPWRTDKRRPVTRQGTGQENKAQAPSLASTSGQVVLEYILLLTISVGVAVTLTKQLVSRNPDSPGLITATWSQINTAIGEDIVD